MEKPGEGIRSGKTYIQGSVEPSPSGDLFLSEDLPGAKTPRPYPRMEMHHGSFIVSLGEQGGGGLREHHLEYGTDGTQGLEGVRRAGGEACL